VELCRALAERYVEPVLCGQYGWLMETQARSGRALTSICKNDYGRTVPYNVAQWLTFYRKDAHVPTIGRNRGKRDDAQFFVRIDPHGIRYGLRLGREARAANRRFRRNVQTHAELLYRALAESGAPEHCLFGDSEDGSGMRPRSPGDLRTWAIGKMLVATRSLTSDATLLWGDELVGDILLTFDRLLPAYACAVEEEPKPFLERRLGGLGTGEPFTDADFCQATFLGEDWLSRARSLLELKRQLILQGVPGTGKTHVAKSLARLLTRGCRDAVRLVQFHPSYSYEEFVEGIKVKSVEKEGGHHDVTYPVEDGVLCALAAEAERAPSQPFVLLIDEINRGNLPRVFGELLYLLEYRDQTVGLPYSRRAFRLPANLYLIGTMNGADRSVALLDQALRRRFSFLEMPPDAAVLARWLEANQPADESLAVAVVALFERLNAQLRSDLGPHCQVGHSYFMVPGLDRERLAVVWAHHVRPLLEEYFAGQPDRLQDYEPERLLGGTQRESTRRRKRTPG
jgi:MoxR-like ATPase